MADLIAQLETQVLVDHQSFDLLDDGGPQRASVDYASTTRWLFAGDNAVTVLSASGRTHVADVTIEVWDGAPERPAGWPEEQAATVRLDSGLLEVNPLVEGEETDWLQVGPAGVYQLRAYAAGRAEIRSRQPPAEVELRSVERYLFQFWSQH